MTRVCETINGTIDTYAECGGVTTLIADGTGGAFPYPGCALVGRYTVPAGFKLAVESLALGFATPINGEIGTAVNVTRLGTAVITVDGTDSSPEYDIRSSAGLDTIALAALGGRCTLHLLADLGQGIDLTAGQVIAIEYTPTATPGGIGGTIIPQRITATITSKDITGPVRRFTQDFLIPYDTTAVSFCSLTAPSGGSHILSVTIESTWAPVTVWAQILIAGVPVVDRYFGLAPQESRRPFVRIPGGFTLHENQSIELYAAAPFPANQKLGLQIAGNLTTVGGYSRARVVNA